MKASDVGRSQITVGAVALPLMVMLALSRMEFYQAATQKPGKGDTEHD